MENTAEKIQNPGYCQLQLTLFFTFCDINHQCQAMSELCAEPLWYGGQTDAIAMLHICFKFKALHTLLNSAEYTITSKRSFFLFPCIKILLGHSNRWTLCNPHQPSCSVRSSWEGRPSPSFATLPFSLGELTFICKHWVRCGLYWPWIVMGETGWSSWPMRSDLTLMSAISSNERWALLAPSAWSS